MARKQDLYLSCPSCDARVPVALGPDDVCPDCESAAAWARYGKEGARLRIDGQAIARAVTRRTPIRSPFASRVVVYLLALGLGVGVVGAVVATFGIFRDRPLGPLDEIVTDVARAANRSLVSGVAVLLAGVGGLILVLRSRFFRLWALTGTCAVAIGAGSIATLVGGLSLRADFGWQFRVMPPWVEDVATLPGIRRIMAATTVIVAPDHDGNATLPALGTGAIIHREDDRAWIVTCSHVAMPYAAVASFRDVAAAQPVWVYFSDGRNFAGEVRWTAQPPLDVALVAVEITDPPPAVPVGRSAEGLDEGSAVRFVPNPMRSGWQSHRGTVAARRAHLTPAGRFNLIITDLPLEPGDSGSGLFDDRGRLVGLNTWRTELADGESLGTSLPTEVMERITELVERGDLSSLESPR